MKKHLFLTGDKQVGKSTLLNKLIMAKSSQPCGIQTLPFYIEGEKKGYYLHQLSLEKSESLSNNPPAILCLGPRQTIGVQSVFETLGVAMLLKSLEQKELMVLDELGRVEKNFLPFINTVEKCLNEKEQIFGVVQKGATHYETMVKKHPRVCIVEVTTQNRERLFDEIMAQGF